MNIYSGSKSPVFSGTSLNIDKILLNIHKNKPLFTIRLDTRGNTGLEAVGDKQILFTIVWKIRVLLSIIGHI